MSLSCIAVIVAMGPAWAAGFRAEGDEGNSTAANLPPLSALRLEPELSLKEVSGELRGLIDYAPRLILGQSAEAATQLLHRARGNAEWLFGSASRVVVEEQASYGRENFSPLVRGTTAQPIDPRLASLSSLAYGSSSTSLRYDEALTRRSSVSAQAAYVINGGLDDEARKQVPVQRGPQLAAEGRWMASRTDELAVQLSGLRTSFSTGAAASVLKSLAGLRSQLGPATTVGFAAGASAAITRGSLVSQAGSSLLPAAAASVMTAVPLRGQRLSGSLALDLGAAVDSLTGDVYERAESRAALDWSPLQSWSLSVAGSGAHNLGGPFPGQGLLQSVWTATATVNPRFAIAAGLRTSWVHGELAVQPSFQWTGFLVASVSSTGAF